MALRNTLLEGIALMSGFQGGNVREEVGFQLQPSGLLLPSPSRVEDADLDEEEPILTQSTENGSKVTSPLDTARSANRVATPSSDLETTSDCLTERELQEIDDAINTDLDRDKGMSAMVLYEDIRV